jgi:hypothetical protein
MNNYQILKLLNNKKNIERDIEKCNEKIFNFETKINTINNLFGTIEQVPLSQINHQIDIINELNLIKKELNKKIKELNAINMIYENLQKPRLSPIVSEIIQPAVQTVVQPVVQPVVQTTVQATIQPIIQPMIVEQPIVQSEQEEKEEQSNNHTLEIYNALNYLQDQINNIISRVTNLELNN